MKEFFEAALVIDREDRYKIFMFNDTVANIMDEDTGYQATLSLVPKTKSLVINFPDFHYNAIQINSIVTPEHISELNKAFDTYKGDSPLHSLIVLLNGLYSVHGFEFETKSVPVPLLGGDIATAYTMVGNYIEKSDDSSLTVEENDPSVDETEDLEQGDVPSVTLYRYEAINTVNGAKANISLFADDHISVTVSTETGINYSALYPIGIPLHKRAALIRELLKPITHI